MIKIFEAFLSFTMIFVSTQSSDLAHAGNSTDEISEHLDAKAIVRQHSDHIKVCQVGYLVDETKIAILTSEPQGNVVVRNSENDAIVASLPIGTVSFDSDTGDSIQAIDLTEVSMPGRYYLDVPGVGSSFDFRVGNDIFTRTFQMSMLFYAGQRCGAAVRLGGDFSHYHHAECHVSDAHLDASTGRKGNRSLTGGWHDAGDFGRYSVNSGISVGTLLWAYELNSEKLRDVELILPEKAGLLPNMLAEIRWNLDWMLEMQDESGGVWHKATTAKFPGSILPESDKARMLIVGSGHDPYLTTQATGNLVAVAAIAARVYRPFDPDYAERCLSAARRGWRWLESTPDSHFRSNPKGIETGAYEDDDANDERLWAAAELFRTTGDAAYHEYFLSNYRRLRPMFNSGFPHEWKNVHALALYGYAIESQKDVDPKVQQEIRQEALKAADEIVTRVLQTGYRVPLTTENYIWGSNALVANYGMMLRLANRISPKPEYVNAAQDSLHYLLGRNTFNTSFVTHVGSRWPMNPHHRPSEADDVLEPWPGMLIGGPNAQDASDKRAPARQWNDVQQSFTTNEVAINWNAPLVFLLAEALPNQVATGAVDSKDLNVDISDPTSWIIDTMHLGTKQVEIGYDAADQSAVITPTWSKSDRQSTEISDQNVDHGRLHLYQHVDAIDCTQADCFFEISMPKEYIDEGKMDLVFALQAGEKGDYLFNGRTFTMNDFVDHDGGFKKLIVNASDYNEPSEKLRSIERVSFIFERKGSVVSAPVKIRRISIDLNTEKIIPPAEEVRVRNPKTYYDFNYTNQVALDGLQVRVSNESMDITRRIGQTEDGVELTPQWKEGQIPKGHTGNVVLVQSLGAPHHFDPFEVEYLLQIPKAYFDEGKLDLYLFVQAGEAGHYRWSGTQRPLASFAEKANQDVVLKMTEEDFRTQGKKRNQIEMVGIQLNRNGSMVTEPIVLRRIVVKLPNDAVATKKFKMADEPSIKSEPTHVWKSDCRDETTFVNSTHSVLPGHYEYIVDPAGNDLVFRGRLTDALKVDDPESVHLHPDIYFDEFHPGNFTVNFDVWVADLVPDELGPYREKPWLNVLTVFDRTTRTGDDRFEPSVMTNLVGEPGAYYLQTYSMSPKDGGTFFEKDANAPVFPTYQWVSVKVDVDVHAAIVRTYQDGKLVSEGPYKSRPGIAGAHMGLYTNRLISQATVYNRACEISFGPVAPSQLMNNAIDEMMVNGDFVDGISKWHVEQRNGAKAKATSVPEGPRGDSAIRIEVEAVAGEPWQLQLYQNEIAIQKGKSYTLTFWCKSNRSGSIKTICMQDHEPWEHSTEKAFSLSTDWQKVEFTFEGPWDDEKARITFTNLAIDEGRIFWFANCSLRVRD
jgi:endoglucanase